MEKMPPSLRASYDSPKAYFLFKSAVIPFTSIQFNISNVFIPVEFNKSNVLCKEMLSFLQIKELAKFP